MNITGKKFGVRQTPGGNVRLESEVCRYVNLSFLWTNATFVLNEGI